MTAALTLQKKSKSGSKSIREYACLLQKVKERLALGQKRIEWEKVRAYWDAGRWINRHILANRERAGYGERVIEKLSRHLGLSDKVLWKVKEFPEKFPILSTWRELAWSHFRLLIPIESRKLRYELAGRANRLKWTVERLEAEITRLKPKLLAGPSSNGRKQIGPALLTPKLGLLYTYRLIEREVIHQEASSLWIDLGFSEFKRFRPEYGKGFRAGQILESRKIETPPFYRLVHSGRTEDDLFTYKAFVERAVDADTFWVLVDQGFDSVRDEILRLRGIDAFELDTPEGKRAFDFVKRELRSAPYVLITTSRTEKFRRYLADLFYPAVPGRHEGSGARVTIRDPNVENGKSVEFIFLNNLLLEKGFAVRV